MTISNGRIRRHCRKLQGCQNSKHSKLSNINAPKDFKQCQNISFTTEKKNKKQSIGKQDNVADEVLECMQSVDDNLFVQHVFKSKGKLPYFILYPDEQIDDLNYFVSHQNNFVLGIDRTFNLGSFYVTAVVYKNQRVVRSDRPQDHPLFLGLALLHRDSTFEAYHHFLSAIKATLCRNHNIQVIEVSLDRKLTFGSEALTKAIESVFPLSTRLLCSNHIKDNIIHYMQKQAGIPQKDRGRIVDAVFNKEGVTNADDSIVFDKKCKSSLKLAKKLIRKFIS